MMTIFSNLLIRKKEIITYNDDIVFKAKTKTHFHETLRKSKLTVAPDKKFSFPAAVEFLGHVIT